GSVAAARPARRLGEELKRALGGAKVRQPESHIRGYDAHQRHAGKVVALGDQLGADQDIDLARAEVGKDFLELPPAPRRVAVQALHARAREKFRQLALDLLRPLADVVKVLAVADRAASGHDGRVTAVMAHEAMLATVIGERDGTVHASD